MFGSHQPIRAMSQGTVREPSAKAKVPSSYQETAEDEKTARNRAILTAELMRKQARQRAEDERLKMIAGKTMTGLSGKRVPGATRTVLSKKNNVSMRLMYLNHRSNMSGNKTKTTMTPIGVSLNRMSHAPLRCKATTGRGRRNKTLLSPG